MMTRQEVIEFIVEECKRVFGVEPVEDYLDKMIQEFYRVKEEYMRMGFNEEEAEILAKGTIRQGMEIGRMRLDLGQL